MSKATPISVSRAFEAIQCLPNRTPHTAGSQGITWFTRLSDYRDGAVFISHFAGTSEWERHIAGDEVVHVLEGETILVLWMDEREVRHPLSAGDLLIVPAKTWHRFETTGVKLLTVSPQPTDHTAEHPAG